MGIYFWGEIWPYLNIWQQYNILNVILFVLKLVTFPNVTQKTEKSRYFEIGELIKD